MAKHINEPHTNLFSSFGNRRARLYPDCGCDHAENCVPCPNCGSCMSKRESCPCMSMKSDDVFGYDIYSETFGG